MYASDYPGPLDERGGGQNDPYVPIDINAVARRAGMSPELAFGRLYFHLDQKYRYKHEGGATTSLFQLHVGSKRHAVQFPYLASILAEKNQEFRRFSLSLALSAIALRLSFASLFLSIAKSAQ